HQAPERVAAPRLVGGPLLVELLQALDRAQLRGIAFEPAAFERTVVETDDRQGFRGALRFLGGLRRAVAHQMLSARLSTASAASFMASESDGCAWQIMPMSSPLARDSMATTASAISSEAYVQRNGTPHHVTDRPHAGEIRAALLVHGDEAALELEADAFAVEAFGVGDAADRDDEPIENRALRLALRVGVFDRDVLFRLHARDFHAELDLQTLLGEDLPRFPGDLLVGHTQENRQSLEDRHLRAEPAPHAPHFQPDHARADDAEAFRHLGNGERPVVAEDQLLVECRARQCAGTRAGGDDDVARREGLSAHGDFAAFGH